MSIISPIITPLAHPFAYVRTDNVQPLTAPLSPDTVANVQTGFPELQATDLTTPNATPVKEVEMNGALNYYTNYIVQMGQGGVYTYDPTTATAIGGYPLGAVLWSAYLNAFTVSLQNNNTADFVSNTTLANDGVNWKSIIPAQPIATQATNGIVAIATAGELTGSGTIRPQAVLSAQQIQASNPVQFGVVPVITSGNIPIVKQKRVTDSVSQSQMTMVGIFDGSYWGVSISGSIVNLTQGSTRTEGQVALSVLGISGVITPESYHGACTARTSGGGTYAVTGGQTQLDSAGSILQMFVYTNAPASYPAIVGNINVICTSFI